MVVALVLFSSPPPQISHHPYFARLVANIDQSQCVMSFGSFEMTQTEYIMQPVFGKDMTN
jgi:hypothetical protein